MGKPVDPLYWRKWRAAHPEYKSRERQRAISRYRADPSSWTHGRRASRAIEPLPQLYPELNHGKAIAFWEDELRMDLAQERALALLENRDPDIAVAAYKSREHAWRQIAGPLLIEE